MIFNWCIFHTVSIINLPDKTIVITETTKNLGHFYYLLIGQEGIECRMNQVKLVSLMRDNAGTDNGIHTHTHTHRPSECEYVRV